MKKRIFFGLSLLSISAMGLAACGASAGSDGNVSNQETTTTQEMSTDNTDSSTTTTYATTESTEVTTTTTEESVAANYDDWHELSVAGSDSSGYTFNRNIKISNWFSEDKKEELEKIWSTISDDPFPDDSTLGLLNGGYYTAFLDGHKNFYDYTDVFYAIGTVDLENTTENFSGTADIDYNIKVTAPDNNGNQSVIGGTLLLTNMNKLYEASGTGFMDNTKHDYIKKKVSTTSIDNFVIMGLIRKTPYEPDGDYKLNETTIHFCYEELPISID